MMDLSYLFNGAPPPAVTTSGAGQNGLPEWYQDYVRGAAGKATEIAGQQSQNPIPQMGVADFTPDQLQAFGQVRGNQGAWRPGVTQANNTLGAGSTLINNAQTAVAGPAQMFPDKFNQYMSPFTMSVVNEIGRLGNQNFSENIMPQINAQMISAGQYGSTRNADVLGRAARDTQQNISGQQAQALETGYGMAGNLFGQDANRQQQQQQMQGSAALQGANTAATVGTAQGALGQVTAAMGLGDAQALQASGQQQQQFQQGALDTAYQNQNTANNYDWNTLNNLNSVVRGIQLPQTQTMSQNGPLAKATFGESPLAQVGQAYGAIRP